jgi:hypothetical protein
MVSYIACFELALHLLVTPRSDDATAATTTVLLLLLHKSHSDPYTSAPCSTVAGFQTLKPSLAVVIITPGTCQWR